MSTDPIWTHGLEQYLGIKSESRNLILYPKLLKLIEEFSAEFILDYGCGDGSFVSLLDSSKTIGIFDTSPKGLALARRKLRARDVSIYSSNESIPSRYYQCVIVSLVLMTLGTVQAIRDVLMSVKRVKREDAKAIISVTHPCFRQYNFSTFYTEYSEQKEFDYFTDGARFTVHLRDLTADREIAFTDYHWSLSTTLNLIIEAGFRIIQVIEIPDTVTGSITQNRSFPPYLIVVCE